MGSVESQPQDLEKFLATAPADQPIVMINLLRYRDQADYPLDAGADPCSGAEAYERYGRACVPLILEHGGKPIWAGSVLSSVIAPADEAWDQAVLVEYPSPADFVSMISSDAYQAIAFHRTAALRDSRLIATQQAIPLRS